MTRAKKKSPDKKNEALGFNFRLGLVTSIFILFAGALSARLFYLQIIQHEELVAQSEKQYQSAVKIYYGRGSIFDRNGTPLASNIEAESVYVSPVEIFNKKEAARQLSKTLNLSFDSVLRKISTNKQFAWIKRKCDLKEIDALRALNLAGVGFIVEHKRYYPKRELAANVLGFVGLDNQGLSGVELYHHELLKGFTQLRVMEKDARGRPVSAFSSMINADRGSSDVVLTLDEVIQFTAEYHLKKQVEAYKAKSGIAVVMDPNTGEILALASAPQFNPNQYGSYKPAAWRNNIVGSSYEPGSIFKPIIAAAALDQGLARPQDIFFCENGSFKLGRTHIGEAANHKFGWLTLRDIISKSSNIGSIKIAQQVGEQTFYDYMKKFGFGEKSGIDLPGEAGGQLKEPERWSKLSLASISFGQEVGVTPIQMISALSSIANGGRLMQPHVAKAVMKNGQKIKTFPARPVKRVISERASKQMVDILKTVVKEGTGGNAAIDGYEVAGKTGTAQKYNPQTKSYSQDDYISSFIGFVPADAPRLAILVMIDEPRGSYWGGTVAAPVFKDIAEKALRYLNVPSTKEQVFILDRA